MKSRLQKKDVFIPFFAGLDTDGDPRMPSSPTIVCENVDFNTDKTARRRDALATLVGNVAADTPTAFSNDKYMAYSTAGLVFFGKDGYEYSSNGSYDNVFVSNDGRNESIRIDSDFIHRKETDASALCSGQLSAHDLGDVTAVVAGNSIIVYSDETKSIINSNSNSLGYTFSISNSNTCWAVGTGALENALLASYNSISDSFTHEIVDVTPLSLCYYNSIGSANTAIGALSDEGKMYVYAINLDSATFYDNTNFNILSSSEFSVHQIKTASGHILTAYVSSNGASVQVGASLDGANATDILHLSNVNASVVSSLTNVEVGPVCVYETATNSGHIVASYRSENSRPTTFVSNFYVSDGSLTINSVTNFCTGHFPASPALVVGGVPYIAFVHYGGRWWGSDSDSVDMATSQGCAVLFRGTGDYSASNQFSPVGMIGDLPYIRIYNYWSDHATSTPWISNSISMVFPESKIAAYSTGWTANHGYGSSVIRKVTVNFSDQTVVHPEFGSYCPQMSQLPRWFDGSQFVPMSTIEYPEGCRATVANSSSGNFTLSGGAGEYYYSSTYSYTDTNGRTIESAPSPSTQASITNVTSVVTFSVPSPFLLSSAIPPGSTAKVNVYRTSADANDFFQVAVVECSSSDVTTFTDYGKVAFSINAGIDVIVSGKYLYTANGELENYRPYPHFVSCVHSGRYFYTPSHAESGTLYYSKSDGSFNEVLDVGVASGNGNIKHLSSHNEKLYIGKERAWLVTYGEPLNDTGAGQGFAAPRLLSAEAGVKYPTAAAAGTHGIFFINSVDGHVYLIDNSEQIHYIGGPVRYYTDAYAYDNVWYAPQDSCVRFSSATVGAPTLSFNYKRGRWSTFTGRYDDGIRAAFVAPIGPSNSYVDVVMDVNGNVYVQDPVGTNAKLESFNVNISTSWISLDDIAGYGKFYKWTLVGGKKKSTLSIDLKTAYDYEPYWTDSQTYNADALVNFSIEDQFGTMANNAVVDNALKIEVDGSRHKTDAVRLCVSTNGGTLRDEIEILGAKLEIGVRPGSTKLGSGRTVS